VGINYRLPINGNNTFMTVDDVAGGVAWAEDNFKQFGAKPNRTVLLGEDAGALIAAVLATAPGHDWFQYETVARRPLNVVGLVGDSGSYDGNLLDNGFGDPYRNLSPNHVYVPPLPRMILLYGAQDQVGQNEALNFYQLANDLTLVKTEASAGGFDSWSAAFAGSAAEQAALYNDLSSLQLLP
jgi:hypothetical protein